MRVYKQIFFFFFQDPIKLKYVVSYTMDDETITEMGEIEELLLAEK